MPETHVDMRILYDKVESIVRENWTGPTTYLYPIYTYYFPLLNGKMKALTEHIFTQYTIPELTVNLTKFKLNAATHIIAILN